jgi:hypothetical protein
LVVGVLLSVVGLGISIFAVYFWKTQNFGPLDMSHSFRLVIPGALCLTLGVQAIFSSFFLSVLGMRRK